MVLLLYHYQFKIKTLGEGWVLFQFDNKNLFILYTIYNIEKQKTKASTKEINKFLKNQEINQVNRKPTKHRLTAYKTFDSEVDIINAVEGDNPFSF
jgi:hypothetical protein